MKVMTVWKRVSQYMCVIVFTIYTCDWMRWKFFINSLYSVGKKHINRDRAERLHRFNSYNNKVADACSHILQILLEWVYLYMCISMCVCAGMCVNSAWRTFAIGYAVKIYVINTFRVTHKQNAATQFSTLSIQPIGSLYSSMLCVFCIHIFTYI